MPNRLQQREEAPSQDAIADVARADGARTGAETAELIAEKAAELFAEKGYAATSIREIAEASKVTKPTIYYHFGSKDGLFRHLIERTLNLYRAYLEDLASRTDFEAALTELAREQLAFAASHPATITLFVRLDVQKPHNLGVDLESVHLENHELLVGFFERAKQAGVFGNQDPRFLALSFVGMMFTHLMARAAFPHLDFPEPEVVASNLMSLFLDGARAPGQVEL